MVWLLSGYMWLYIHRPFEVWPWIGDLRVERLFMIMTIICWIVSPKVWKPNPLNRAFLLFTIAIFTSWIFSPYSMAGDKTMEDYCKVGIFYILVVSSVNNERDFKRLLLAYLISVALYMTHSLWEYRNGRHVWTMGTARMIGVDQTYSDPNTFAATLLYSLPLIIPFWNEFKTDKRKKALFVGYILLTLTCILLTGSRTAFAGLLVFALCLSFVYRPLRKNILKTALVLAVISPIAWNLLPPDRQNRYLTLYDPSYGPANAQGSAESREVFFWQAYELWKETPLLGYGPGSFPRASGTKMQVHTLYGQLLGEVGLLGTFTFLGILYAFYLNTMADEKKHSLIPESVMQLFISNLRTAILLSVILMLFNGLGGHNLFRYTWLWFGAFLVIALHVKRQHNNTTTTDPMLLSVPV